MSADLILDPYDAVLLLSFGGPETPEEVVPFLRRVTAGRGIPDERLAEVGEHYFARGGRSPINDECRALRAALVTELGERGCRLPVVWGNRNADPFLADVLREAHEAGVRRVVTVLTSAYSGYSSCRQYREDLAAAQATLAAEGRHMTLEKIRPYALTDAFVDANARLLLDALAAMTAGDDERTEPPTIAFVTHSVPVGAADHAGPPAEHGPGAGAYRRQHLDVAHRLAARAEAELGAPVAWDLVFCSRSGPTAMPWLEPDVNDHLEALATRGVTRVLLAPIGFVSDHMEVVHDLDTEAMATAARLGVEAVRVPTVRADRAHVSGLVDLLAERAAEARGEDVTVLRAHLGGEMPSTCAAGCCPGRARRPALAGEETE